MPSIVLIRPTVWPQCTNVTDGQDRQDRQDRQRDRQTDNYSIGRTVLQTVAQKLLLKHLIIALRSRMYERNIVNTFWTLPEKSCLMV